MDSVQGSQANHGIARQIDHIVAEDINRKLQAYLAEIAAGTGLPNGASDGEVAAMLDFEEFVDSLIGVPLDDQAMRDLRALGADSYDVAVLLPLWHYGIVSDLSLAGDLQRVMYRRRSS